MDSHRFDFAAVLRAIPDIVPRRTALGGLLGAGLALLTRFDAQVAGVRRKRRKKKGKRKKKCKGGTKKCGKQCIPTTDCCGCSQEECCDGKCVDLETDGANCGACGQTCLTALCVHGACACVNEDECPDACFCVPRAQGAAACSDNNDLGPECTVDDDCPLGRFCIEVDETRVCSAPCPG